MSPGCDSQQDPEPWPCLQQHAPLLPSSPLHLVSPELLFWTLLRFPILPLPRALLSRAWSCGGRRQAAKGGLTAVQP